MNQLLLFYFPSMYIHYGNNKGYYWNSPSVNLRSSSSRLEDIYLRKFIESIILCASGRSFSNF